MIVVFGSINLDLVIHAARLPQPGETALGPSLARFPGGKGANQALAAARAGAPVLLAGAVGADAFADEALALLDAGHVDLSRIERVTDSTGIAFITVDAAGENLITVASGANRHASAGALRGWAFSSADILLLQREVPEAACLAAARMAKAGGTQVILNLAPASPVAQDLLDCLDVLVMNAHEAEVFAAARDWPERDPGEIARRTDHELGIACIVTLGAEGCVGWRDGVRRTLRPPSVEVVDTVGAGDAFVGALAAALHRGFGFSGALQRAVAAGALACTRPGAQPSLPHFDDIERLAAAHAF
jgi:ribokinase